MKGPYNPVLFTINDKTYAVSGSHWVEILQDISNVDVQFDWIPPVPISTERPKEVRREVLSSNGDKTYVVKLRSDGLKTCECSGFMYRRHCRHVDELKKELGW